MKKIKTVVIAQVWQLGLAQEIGKGIYEYARRGVAWDIRPMDYGQVLRNIKEWEFDALIIPVIPESQNFDVLISKGIPLVSTHHLPDHPEIPQVDADNPAAGAEAARFFAAGGYKHFSAVFGSLFDLIVARRDAFRDTLLNECGPDTPVELFALQEEAKASEWMRRVPKPAAMFCTDDATARMMIKLALKNGLAVPDDLAVLGCQDDMMVCEGIRPSISSVRLPYRKAGYEAARLMDLLLKGKKSAAQAILLPPEGVTERMSTGTVATRDMQLNRAVEYLHRHFAEEGMNMAAAARHAGLSLRTLQMRFKNELSCTPAAYLQNIRIDQAKTLLRDTRMSMEEIAEAVGYANGNYLTKTFSAVTGQTARAYRNQFHS